MPTKKKKSIVCGHGTTQVFWCEFEGRQIHWCVNCGAIQCQSYRRGAFGSVSYDKYGKWIKPKMKEL